MSCEIYFFFIVDDGNEDFYDYLRMGVCIWYIYNCFNY